MRRIIYLFIIIIGLITACDRADNKTNSGSTSNAVPDPAFVDQLKGQKALVDTLYNKSTDSLTVLAVLTDHDIPVTIEGGKFPDNVETSFSILKDSSGKVLSVSEFPSSRSGDWHIVFTHYFDKDGKTFAFERQTNFFNSFCAEGVAYETRTEFYNNHFQKIDTTYKLVDENNRVLPKDSCHFPYNHEYEAVGDVAKYFQINKIKNQ